MDKRRPRLSHIPRLQTNKVIVKKSKEVVNVKDENNCELTPQQMKEALTKIALELQRIQSNASFDTSEFGDNTYRTKLKNKRKQIRCLKENLNTACMVAKTLTDSKEKEYNSLNKHLSISKNQNERMQSKIDENTKIIQELKSEKSALLLKLEHLNNFIKLGYKELQSIRKEDEKDLPIELQLKEIIVSCGQYYADFSNEHERCSKLDQRNRFLSNKLIILERNLEVAAAELSTHMHRQRSKSGTKQVKNNTDINTNIGCVRSEYSLSRDINVGRVIIEPITISNNCYSSSKDVGIDLTSHISLIKNLMDDQEMMLSELKKLSDDLN